MSVLKQILFSLLFLSMLQAGAQNLSDVFAKSYAAEKTGNYTVAISEMNADVNRSSYEVNLRLGWLFYLDKKHNESVAFYQKAIALKPFSTEPLWGIIYPLSVQEKWTGIEQVYKEILKLDAGNSKANYYLGSIYFYRKDYNAAKKYLSVVTALYPFDHDANLLLAWTTYYLGNKTEAQSLFYHVLNNKPEDASAKEGLALIK